MPSPEEVISLIAEELGKEPSELSLASEFEQLDVDSLEFVNLMLAAENKFGCKIADSLYPSISTIADLVKVVSC